MKVFRRKAQTPAPALVRRASFPRYCGLCDKYMGEGPDVCLGTLPGVSHACCGHGETKRAYVVIGGVENQRAWTISNGVRLDGGDALEFFDLLIRGVRIIDGDLMENLPGDAPEEQHTNPRRDAMATLQKESKVFRSVLKKTPRTAAEIALKAGYQSGRQISNELAELVAEGAITRTGIHSGNTRPTYVKTY